MTDEHIAAVARATARLLVAVECGNRLATIAALNELLAVAIERNEPAARDEALLRATRL